VMRPLRNAEYGKTRVLPTQIFCSWRLRNIAPQC
jgi:hypothetical protein